MREYATLITILYADDDAEERMLERAAWNESRVANEMVLVEDGEELMDYLRRRGQYAELAAPQLGFGIPQAALNS